jgi:hypothetical protein
MSTNCLVSRSPKFVVFLASSLIVPLLLSQGARAQHWPSFDPAAMQQSIRNWPRPTHFWATHSTCDFNGHPMGCFVRGEVNLDYPAYMPTYTIDWNDGLRQAIYMRSDVGAFVVVNGKITLAEQQDSLSGSSTCLVRTMTNNLTKFPCVINMNQWR